MGKSNNNLIRAGAVVMLIVTALAFGGCTVKTKRQLINYARETYGEAKYIGNKSKLGGEDAYTTVILEDKDTGIQYEVTSSMTSIGIDGSFFGRVEQTSSDFEKLYYEYLIDEASSELDDLSEEYRFTYNFQYEVFELVFEDRDAGADAGRAAAEFDEILSAADVKNMRPHYYILKTRDNVTLGSYDAQNEDYSASNDTNIIDYVHKNYDADAVYLDSIGAYIDQFLPYDEVDILFPGHDGSPSGTAYYFRDKDGDTFVAIDLDEFGAKKGGIRLFRDKASGMEEIEY